MTVRYRDLMHANEPVHGWPVGCLVTQLNVPAR